MNKRKNISSIEVTKRLVSIIMPTYNRMSIIGKAIESVLRQTYQNWELIIVNDCSSDNTSAVVRKYGDKRITLIDIKKNLGSPGATRNIGIKKSRGEYIAYLDDDNTFRKNHIERLAEVLNRRSDIGLVYCSAELHFEDMEETLIRDVYFKKKLLLIGNYIDTSDVMHRRECLAKSGFWNESKDYEEDWELWKRMAAHYDFYHIKEVLTDYNFHSGTRTHELHSLQTPYESFKAVSDYLQHLLSMGQEETGPPQTAVDEEA